MIIPKLVAHRGYTLHYPENTLVAVEAAITAGAQFVEIDVQLSADGVPILFHDDDLKRVCGADGAVADHSLIYLKQLRASEPERFGGRYADVPIATVSEFAELIRQYPHVTAFVELKHEALARFSAIEVLQRLRAELTPIKERVVLISYVLEALALARREGWPRLGVVLDSWEQRQLPSVREIAPHYFFCDTADVPSSGRLNVTPAQLVAFEVAEVDTALSLAQRGVDFIETFAIGELKRQLDQRSTH